MKAKQTKPAPNGATKPPMITQAELQALIDADRAVHTRSYELAKRLAKGAQVEQGPLAAERFGKVTKPQTYVGIDWGTGINVQLPRRKARA